MHKQAISVTVSNAEPETGFVAGMPTSPTTSISRTEVLAAPRRVPKAMSYKAEVGVPTAIAEGAREMVDQLERKFGEAFLRGFLEEMEKDADLYASFQRWLGKTPSVKRPTSPLQAAIQAPKASIKTRLEGVKPMITRPQPMRGPEPGAEFARFEPRIRQIERAREKMPVPTY